LIEKGTREKKLKYYLKKTLNDLMNFEEEIEREIENSKEELENSQEGNKVTGKNYLLQAAEILTRIEEKFSEYLKQFEKEWESTTNRIKWKEIILNSSKFKNFVTTLEMFNFRFKSPYKQEESSYSEEVDILNSGNDNGILPKFVFTDDNGENLEIFESDPFRILSPKVKIWPKELENSNIDKYYTEIVLPSITNKEHLMFSIHFIETVIYGLVKRRENIKKANNNISNNLLKDMAIVVAENEPEFNDTGNNIEVSEMIPQDDQENINLIKLSVNTNKEFTDNNEKINNINIDADKTESIKNISEHSSVKKEKCKKKTFNKIKKIKETVPISNLERKKRNAQPKDLRLKDWRETCYICGDYGNLICCEGCTNVSHLFCACLTVKFLYK
jgi:hypothetical protein